MSKIGKTPIQIPTGVEFRVDEANQVVVKGPKGELTRKFDRSVGFELKNNKVIVSVKNPDNKMQRALWGLSRSLLNNMVIGSNLGYEKKLEINGVGYRAALQGKSLNFNLGFSHPVIFEVPSGIEAKVEKNVITISGIDKQQVGEIAAQIRHLKPPEPYKGKGIRYIDEVVRRKAGKVAKTAEGAK
jgi:large subunit ribosomal protein L6